MSFGLNTVIITGNLTRDGEIKTLPGGTSLLNFSVAVNDDYYDKQTQQTKEQSYFFDCTIFGKRAESLVKFLVKGQKIAVEGKLTQNRWTDQQTQQNRSKVQITASNIVLMGSKPQNLQNGNSNLNNNSQANHPQPQQAANFQPGSQQAWTPQKPAPPQQTNFNDNLNKSDIPF